MPGISPASHYANHICIDFGSEYLKCFIYNSEQKRFSEFIKFRNRIYKLNKKQKKLDHDRIKDLNSNFLTKREVDSYDLKDNVDEIAIKPHWLRRNVSVLAKFYQNIFEIVEDHYKVNLFDEKDNWLIHVALPLTEQSETFSLIAKNHLKASNRLGFNNFIEENQLYLSSCGEFAAVEKNDMPVKNIRLIVDIGSHDTKVVAFASKPIQSTARRETIGGQNVQKHAIKLSKKLNPTLKPFDVTKWLYEHAHVYEKTGKILVKDTDGQDIDIAPIMGTPKLLFDPKSYGLERKSLIDLISETTVAASKLTGNRLAPMFLSCILLTGGGAKYHGMELKLTEELAKHFRQNKNRIKVYKTSNPEFSCLRGFKLQFLECSKQQQVEGSAEKKGIESS
ncbi:MAG: hypothetical protein ACFFD4_27310 [Candidatus Odinarchaeota archaeon]